jgi:uncharacterized protein (TIGR03067 family)
MPRFTVLALVLGLTALAVGCKKNPADKALAQGEWTIASVEYPDEAEGRKREGLQELLVVIKGDRITISHPKEKGSVSALFTLDPMKAPKEVDAPEIFVAQETDEHAIPEPGRGIYKFEGDELVIALTTGSGNDLPRPTEFKPSLNAAKRQSVLVFHLKRK